MPHFHFNLRQGQELIGDEEGSELPDMEAAYLQAFASAQELWTMLLAQRQDPTAYTFEVVDTNGRLLFVLPLSEVLETAQRRRARPHEAVHRTSELLSRTQALRDSLAAQITEVQQTVARTQRTLGQLGRTPDG